MKKKLILIGVVIVLIVGAVVFFILNNNKKEDKSNSNKTNTEQRKYVTQTEVDFMSEDEIIKTFGITGEDAINIIKDIFNKETYQFEAKYDSGKYFIDVTDQETGEKFVVQFDPVDRSFFQTTL